MARARESGDHPSIRPGRSGNERSSVEGPTGTILRAGAVPAEGRRTAVPAEPVVMGSSPRSDNVGVDAGLSGINRTTASALALARTAASQWIPTFHNYELRIAALTEVIR